MTILRRRNRHGYTLLEVLLAAAIAVLMMSALYVAMDLQIREMEEGRTRVERSTIARALFVRLGHDLAPSLAPIAPVAPTPAAGGAAAAPVEETPSPLVFQIGVKGDNTQVTIYQTRLNRTVIAPPEDVAGAQNPYAGDIRRISYFLSQDDSAKGLARQEIRLVTSEQVDAVPIAVDEYTKMIAEEVTRFDVRYFDGTDWVESWDGSTPGPDGKTPQGPPRAVEITIDLKLPGFDEVKTFTHVIAFQAAPGAPSEVPP